MITPNPGAAQPGVEVILAIAGIAGTLLGAFLGAYGAYKVQELGLRHDDETRFHEHRLTTYVEYLEACNTIVAAVQTGNTSHEDAAVKALRAFEVIKLISSRDVCLVTARVHGFVSDCLSKGSVTPAAVMQYNVDMANLANAFRSDIGTENIAMRSPSMKGKGKRG